MVRVALALTPAVVLLTWQRPRVAVNDSDPSAIREVEVSRGETVSAPLLCTA